METKNYSKASTLLEPTWFVYILLCADDSLYTGSTNNVEKRFEDHVSGHGARYTKSHTPLKVVYQEKFDTKSGALKREAEIKKMSRIKKQSMVHLGHQQ